MWNLIVSVSDHCLFIYFLITSLREEGAGLCSSRAFACLFCTC